MKANRKFIWDEEGVSPVIAVILMVAITVVLAATVFVLVNNLSENVSETAPVLSMANERNTGTEWKISVLSASQSLTPDSYTLLYTQPSGQIVEISPASSFTGGVMDYHTDFELGTARTTLNATSAAATAAPLSLRFLITDVDGNGRVSPTDTISLTYDSNDADAGGFATSAARDTAFANAWPSGEYKLQILHKNSGGIVREMSRTV